MQLELADQTFNAARQELIFKFENRAGHGATVTVPLKVLQGLAGRSMKNRTGRAVLGGIKAKRGGGLLD